MRANEVQDVLAMLAAATQGGTALEPAKQGFWEAQLLQLDAQRATEAVLLGIRTWKFFPSWAEFHAIYADLGKLSEADAQRVMRRQESTSSRTKELPFWLKRWAAARFLYARFGYKEPDMRPFPEQAGHVDPMAEPMPADAWVKEAEALSDRDVWKAVLS